MSKFNQYEYTGKQERVIPTVGRCVKGSVKIMSASKGDALVKEGLFKKVTTVKSKQED